MKKRIASRVILILIWSLAVAADSSDANTETKDASGDQKAGTQPHDTAIASSFGVIKAPTGLAAEIVAKMQQAPSNPDVTCIRARIAVKIA